MKKAERYLLFDNVIYRANQKAKYAPTYIDMWKERRVYKDSGPKQSAIMTLTRISPKEASGPSPTSIDKSMPILAVVFVALLALSLLRLRLQYRPN